MKYPLLFNYSDLVQGNGFVACVSVHGRGMLVDESDGEVWMYGVNPGGIAAGGEDLHVALAELRQTYRAVLFDIANDAASFGEFKDEVNDFFSSTPEALVREWEEARQAVREKRMTGDELGLGTQRAESPLFIEVLKIAEPKAEANVLDRQAHLAA